MEGRSLRGKSSSSSAQVDSQQLKSASLSSDQFALLMRKLNEISTDISIIKANQQILQSDLSECKSILEKHSSEILRHNDTLATHSQTIDQHGLDIATCSSRIDLLTESHRSLKDVVDSTNQRLSRFEKSELSTSTCPNPSMQPSELLDRLRRSHNVLIRGVPETNFNEDSSVVSRILDCVAPDANSHRISVARIGAPSTDRPRILKVSFTNPMIATTILKNKTMIKNKPDCRNCSISDDKTPMQIKELNELREQLKRRINAGESNINIKYLSGTPVITDISDTKQLKN